MAQETDGRRARGLGIEADRISPGEDSIIVLSPELENNARSKLTSTLLQTKARHSGDAVQKVKNWLPFVDPLAKPVSESVSNSSTSQETLQLSTAALKSCSNDGYSTADSSVIAVDSEDSFDAKKSFSKAEVEELERKLAAQRRVVDQNEKMLKRSGSSLPDGGKKLSHYIQKQKELESQLLAKLLHFKDNLKTGDQSDSLSSPASLANSSNHSLNPSISSFGPVDEDGDKSAIIVNEEQKLNFLHKKQRLLKQQYSMMRVDRLPDGGAALRQEIMAVDLEIFKLEPMVKMKNPNYRSNIADAEIKRPMLQGATMQKQRSATLLTTLPDGNNSPLN